MESRRAHAHRHLVLVVDDYAALQEATVLLLESLGYVVLRADSGLEALALLHGGRRPCLVLLDVGMPGMTGLAVRASMGANPAFAAIPVVMMSGANEVVRLAERGHTHVLAKPADANQLVDAIETHARCSAANARLMASHAAAMVAASRTMVFEATGACARASENVAQARERAARLPKTRRDD